MPLQVGCSVFDDSKLKMYQFYYDCIDGNIDRKDYQYITTDTDSAYLALTGEFNNLIKPELKDHFELNKSKWLILNSYDKRTHGLFKIKLTGIGAIALSSKAYYVWSENNSKYSSKGVQKCRAKFDKEQYYNCLNLKKIYYL